MLVVFMQFGLPTCCAAFEAPWLNWKWQEKCISRDQMSSVYLHDENVMEWSYDNAVSLWRGWALEPYLCRYLHEPLHLRPRALRTPLRSGAVCMLSPFRLSAIETDFCPGITAWFQQPLAQRKTSKLSPWRMGAYRNSSFPQSGRKP